MTTSRRRSSPWPRLLPRLARDLSLVFGGVVAINGLVWLGERLAYGTTYADQQPVGLYDRTQSEPGKPLLKAGAQLNGWLHEITINELGWRGPAPLAEKPSQGVRIWVTGGSTSFDIYASSDATTWPAVLAGRLNRERPDRTFEVINAGVPGEILVQAADDFAAAIDPLGIDVLLLHNGPNELQSALRRKGPIGAVGGGHPELRKPDFIEQVLDVDLAVFRVGRRIWARPPSIPAAWAGREYDAANLRLVRQMVENTVDGARKRGVAVVLATHAIWPQPDDTGEEAHREMGIMSALYGLTPEETIRTFDLYNEMIRTLGRDKGIPVVDLRQAVSGDDHYWADSVHYTDEGSAVAAAEAARVMLSSGVLDGKSRPARGHYQRPSRQAVGAGMAVGRQQRR